MPTTFRETSPPPRRSSVLSQDPLFTEFQAAAEWLLPASCLHELPGAQPQHLAATAVRLVELQRPGAPASSRETAVAKREPATRAVLRLVSAVLACKPHPNVMRVLGVVHEPATRTLTSVYEYLRMDLVEVLGQRPCHRELLELAAQAAQGLAEGFHAQGLAHGDVKPDNLLLSSVGVVKVCDFGLVKPIAGSPDDCFQGTLVYAAPELLRREQRGSRSPAADVWAFGCTLYALFARELPYASDEQGPPLPAAAASRAGSGGSRGSRGSSSSVGATGGAGALHSLTATQTHRRGTHTVGEEALELWGVRLSGGLRPSLQRLLSCAPPAPTGLVALIDDCLAPEPGARPRMAEVAERLLALRSELPLRSLSPSKLLRVLFAGGHEPEHVRACCNELVRSLAAASAGSGSGSGAGGARRPSLPFFVFGNANAFLLGGLMQAHLADSVTCTALLSALEALAPALTAGQAEADCASVAPLMVQALREHVRDGSVCSAAAGAMRAVAAASAVCAAALAEEGAVAGLAAAASAHAGSAELAAALGAAQAAVQAPRARSSASAACCSVA
jgi:serine/threonine protein kinase